MKNHTKHNSRKWNNIFLYLLIFLFFLTTNNFEIAAQPFSFSSLNGPYGGNLGDVVFTSDGEIFVSSYYSAGKGIYKSTDNGLSWQLLPPIYPYNEFLALGINKNDVLFAGTSGAGLYRSTDKGETWTWLTSYNSQESWAIAFNDRGHVFAGDGDWGGLYKSIDDGDTWTQLLPNSVAILAIEIDTKGMIYVGASNDFLKSTDDGITWNSFYVGLPNTEISAVLTNERNEIFVGTGYLSQGDGIYYSNDGGENWIQRSLSGQTVYSLTIDQNENLYAGTKEDGVYKSTDSGISWEQINKGLHNKNIFRVKMSATDLLFACSETDGGIYRSTNFGENWEITGVTAGTINRGFISESGDIYAATYSGVQKYNSGTNKWSVLGLTSVSPVRGWNLLSDIIIDNDGILFASSWAGDVYKSSDNGITWDTTASVDTAQTHIVDMALYTDNSVLLGIFGYIRRSTDKGASWTTIINGLLNRIIKNIAVTDEGIVYAVSLDKLYRANHIDSSFIVIKDNIYSVSPIYNRIAVGSDGLIFFADNNTNPGIYRSINYGDSWLKVNDESVASLSLFEDKYVAAGLGSGQGIMLSSDKGDTWTTINEGLPSQSYITWNEMDSDGYLYAAVNDLGVYKTNSIVTSVADHPNAEINDFVLKQNYPNPFNPQTRIDYSIEQSGNVRLKVYDILGNEVAVLVDEYQSPGKYSVTFIPKNLSSGVYIYKLTAGEFTDTKKLVLIK